MAGRALWRRKTSTTWRITASFRASSSSPRSVPTAKILSGESTVHFACIYPPTDCLIRAAADPSRVENFEIEQTACRMTNTCIVRSIKTQRLLCTQTALQVQKFCLNHFQQYQFINRDHSWCVAICPIIIGRQIRRRVVLIGVRMLDCT